MGAPVGSVLLGSEDFIKKARRVRKVFGGGMRQAGYLAAAGIYALENNIDRLALDHQHTEQIASTLAKKEFIGKIMPVETNILIFEVKGNYTARTLKEKLAESEILVMDISPTQIRIVLHLDISEAMVDKTLQVLENL